MRRIVLALMGTLSAVLLLFGYRTSTGGTVAAAPLTTATAPPSASSSGGTSTPTPRSTVGTGGSSGAAKTYDGSVAGTRWGDVQVQITVSGGKVTAARTLQVPDGNPRDVEINDAAVPILDHEVVDAQSAQIDAVSGATVTSDGYITSLQAALDKAGL